MIVSAISLWKKFNLKTPLGASEWDMEERDGVKYSNVSYNGHTVKDGLVRIYARYIRSANETKRPVILLLNDLGQLPDEELALYFVEKGYAVLMPDYSGKMSTDGEGVQRTYFPPRSITAITSARRGSTIWNRLTRIKPLGLNGRTWRSIRYNTSNLARSLAISA